MRIELENVKPMEIERRSFEIITQELGDRKLQPGTELIVKRCIHTSADFDYADNLCFSPGAVEAGLRALEEGCDIVTDTQMAKAGINKKVLAKYGGEVYCFMSDEDVAAQARQQGTTRAVASMDKAAQQYGTTRAATGIGEAAQQYGTQYRTMCAVSMDKAMRQKGATCAENMDKAAQQYGTACAVADLDEKAKRNETIHAAIGISEAVTSAKPVIFAVGNAPTALVRLYELLGEGRLRPALIIGVPVGFVNVVQSKELIMQTDVPFIVARGRKGGSNIAACICNAMLYMLEKDRS